MENLNYPLFKELDSQEIKQIQGGFSPLWLPLIAYKIVEMLSEKQK
ncbi:class IIb bacteriocin, lactobin A/cerein 7B family [Dyadobacter flavalbus]|uniref:Class IIb bacteriocin, lactobin A/cerein 7B family n=1 Tax=Dyadobacter flavalbus TaxID=2579942 RepID=A0A5M8QWF7_9BACT|nr:class IIb bacteriocin, lactobin A/cerein 7B family [Dyadobacter flavalbus]KAA6439390.1 class IIb bacteriocin, lactobin A/cerein 7B family [Dyadobacter flavalbus]